MEAERKGKGLAPAQAKIELKDCNKAHKGITDKIVQNWKMAKQFTRCGINNDTWF